MLSLADVRRAHYLRCKDKVFVLYTPTLDYVLLCSFSSIYETMFCELELFVQ